MRGVRGCSLYDTAGIQVIQTGASAQPHPAASVPRNGRYRRITQPGCAGSHYERVAVRVIACKTPGAGTYPQPTLFVYVQTEEKAVRK